MFIEDQPNHEKDTGWIEVITGSMFSGKTEELIRRLNRATIAKQRVQSFKPQIDTRYDEEKVVSHDESALSSTPVSKAKEILEQANRIDVVGIDEGQFFEKDLVNVCNRLANRGVRVIVAGLDMDYRGVPFGPMPTLLATAEYVTKVHAICMNCGQLANHSFRKTSQDDLFVLGEKDSYEPLCRSCFFELMNEKVDYSHSSNDE
jgi:thymidine kinase